MGLVKWIAGPRAAEEIRQEFRAHREECRLALLAEGMLPDSAEAEAARRFGDEDVHARRCERELLDERLGELWRVGAIAASCGAALVALHYVASSESSRPFQQVFCLHLLYGLPVVLAAGACAARIGHWLVRFGILGLGVLVFWLGLFLGTHMGFGAWQSIDSPPDEAFTDGAQLMGSLLAGWMPGGLLAGAAFAVSALARRIGSAPRAIG